MTFALPVHLTFWIMLMPVVTTTSPHVPVKQTWSIVNPNTGEVANASSSTLYPPKAWFPDLFVDLCDIIGGEWDPSDQEPFPGYGCASPGQRHSTRNQRFYVCPGHSRSKSQLKKCGGPGEGYCAAWGCESTGAIWWSPPIKDLIKVEAWNRNMQGTGTCTGHGACGPCYDSTIWPGRPWATPGGRCNGLKISFTNRAKSIDLSKWTQGLSWGLRLYRTGYDPATTFTIRLQMEPLYIAIGPNLVITNQQKPIASKTNTTPKMPNANVSLPSRTLPTPIVGQSHTNDRLFNLILGAYIALNASDANKTRNCWLCLASNPPYYEGIAFDDSFTNVSTPDTRCQTQPHRLTLSEVSGAGLCLGKVPATHQHLCNKTISTLGPRGFLLPPTGSYWACSTGLTLCVAIEVFNHSSEFCVLIQLWPRVTYYEEQTFLQLFEQKLRYSREPLSVTLALLLGAGGIAAGIGTGTTALIQTKELLQLQAAMTEDLETITKSISALEKSLTSLSEVVLQNRRGLDLLFLKEGGLCAALKEECCFYADHTGVVRDSVEKLQKRLKQRHIFLSSWSSGAGSWVGGGISHNSLLSTLLPFLVPLITLLLFLAFGPWAFQRLTQFIKNQINSTFTKTVSVHYHRVETQEQAVEAEQGLRFSASRSQPPPRG
ncbi:PREDICTED: MLV-related proviral Env polyprotein-like [Dipodomys ordii]|uniref:MLV-related proviral Env polyprotein-like n=1 Tax=Dipodomys ordii TaxID=10020 RepID=A0A1S3GU73_DIPOR|nr:PREDICTED: MLV-related proviral Env polyprotein-like [Dipodomys ordii]